MAAVLGNGSSYVPNSVWENYEAMEKKICVVCEQKENQSVTIKKCSRCQVYLYCSKQCQEKDWKKHKENCVGIEKKEKCSTQLLKKRT